MNRDPVDVCAATGKVVYRSAFRAHLRRLLLLRRRRGTSGALGVFRCTFCGQWHLGRKGRREQL